MLGLLDEGLGGGAGEVGVWVSGFYGSGKSSFTKYLGFALDPGRKIDGKPFLEWPQAQLKTKALRTQLAALAKKHPATLIMLDLASAQIAGATMAEISSVLPYVLGAEFADRLEAAGWRLVSDQQVEGGGTIVLKPNTASLMPSLQPALSSPSTIFCQEASGARISLPPCFGNSRRMIKGLGEVHLVTSQSGTKSKSSLSDKLRYNRRSPANRFPLTNRYHDK